MQTSRFRSIMLQLISNGLPVLTDEQSSKRLQNLLTSSGVSLLRDPTLLAHVNEQTRAACSFPRTPEAFNALSAKLEPRTT